MPHLADKLLTPSKFNAEGVLFDTTPLRAYPGKPIVCMFPAETEREGIIKYIPKEVAEKYSPDFGIVAQFKPRLDLEGDVIYRHDRYLKPGMIVGIKPYTGNWYTHEDFAWIPEGRMVKILGTVEDWDQNILFAIDPESV